MGKNADWFAQIRARGVCYLCRRPMPDDQPQLAHAECYRAQAHGVRAADIRRNPPGLEGRIVRQRRSAHAH